jgi:CBS domain-containing protein
MSVADLIRNKDGGLVTVTPDTNVADAAALLAEKRIGAVVVLKGERLAGILSERDIVRALAVRGGGCLDQTTESIMTANVETCGPDESIESVMGRMTAGRFRHMPVVVEGRVTGIVSIGDLVKSRLSQLEMETESLKQYIASG